MASLVIVGRGILSCSFTDHQLQTGASTTTWTFTNKAIGTAPTDRRFIVVDTFSPTAGDSTSSLTVAGITAAAVTGITGSKMYIVEDNTGTTATIVATNSVARDAFAIGVFAIYGDVNPAPYNVFNAGTVGTTASASLNVPDGGVAVGWGQINAVAPAATANWTQGLSKDFQDTNVSGGALTTSGAHAGTFSGDSTITVTMTSSGSGGSDTTLARAASFAPN